MKKIFDLLMAFTPRRLTVSACYSALIGLLFMVLIVTVPSPLVLVVGMGVAHAFGLLGVILFGAAILREVLTLTSKADKQGNTAPPHEPPVSEES